MTRSLRPIDGRLYRLLEFGCGGGRDAEAMIRRGFVVDATDGTLKIARMVEGRIKQSVSVMRFDQLDAIETYDAVWAHASLLHVPRVGLRKVLRLTHRAHRPGGLHFGSFKERGVDGRDCFGRYFNFFDMPTLLATYHSAASWEIVVTEQYTGNGVMNSGAAPWIAVIVRKRASFLPSFELETASGSCTAL
jgi:SAM-dependent methyltransferase